MDELSTCVYILKICPDYETKRYKHQFKTEINVLSNLNSIHVPSLITCFEEDFAQCFVETYIPGINARQYFQNHRCLFKKYRLLIDVLKVENTRDLAALVWPPHPGILKARDGLK